MNSVMKIGILLIVALSCLYFVEANTGFFCNVCAHSQNSKCQRGEGQCFARPGESCYSISYYTGSRHVFSEQGCRRKCKEVEYRNGLSLTYIMCCDKHLCNSF